MRSAFAEWDRYLLTFPSTGEGFVRPDMVTRGRCEQMSHRNDASKYIIQDYTEKQKSYFCKTVNLTNGDASEDISEQQLLF